MAKTKGSPAKGSPAKSQGSEGSGSGPAGWTTIGQGGVTVTAPPPDVPTMGGYKEYRPGEYAIWVGGKPNKEWTQLEEPDPKMIQPSQFRHSNPTSAQKSEPYRIKGLEKKFGVGDDLLVFERTVRQHFERMGLDTIAYLPNPHEPDEMVSVIKHHPKFTREKALEAEEKRAHLYDEFDIANIRDAKTYVMDSVDDNLLKQVHERCEDEATFIDVWMVLMKQVRPKTLGQFTKIQDRLRKRSLKNYKNEDVNQLCSDYLDDWTELEAANMYDHQLTQHMLHVLINSGRI